MFLDNLSLMQNKAVQPELTHPFVDSITNKTCQEMLLKAVDAKNIPQTKEREVTFTSWKDDKLHFTYLYING